MTNDSEHGIWLDSKPVSKMVTFDVESDDNVEWGEEQYSGTLSGASSNITDIGAEGLPEVDSNEGEYTEVQTASKFVVSGIG